MRSSPSLVLTALVLLALGAAEAAADCPGNPADLAPGALGTGAVPTWRVAGDEKVTVRDLVVLARAVRGEIALAWSEPLTAGCPARPGDLAPGATIAGAAPPSWVIAGDGALTAEDLAVMRSEALAASQFLPGAGRPLEPGDRALAGQVLDSVTKLGLPGVTVTVDGPGYSVTSKTDAAGEFLATGLPLGTFVVVFDGSTATVAGVYPRLAMMADVTGPGTTDMPPTTLPELSSPASAKGEVTVDAAGAATAPFSTSVVGEPAPDLGVSGPVGTKIVVGGVPASGAVGLNVTPVPFGEVPMELPSDAGKLNPASFVTVQPANATFDTNGAAPEPSGLDALLPNEKLFAVGTAVDVWSYDHGVEAWVNRSQQTGSQGTVIDLGGGKTAISAPGVIVAGGWHAPVVPVVPSCATKLTGRVVDSQGAPLSGIFVGTSVGSFGGTAPDGTFLIESVPAYSGATAGGCAAIAIEVTLRSPLGFAHETRRITVAAGSIHRGGETALGDLTLPVDLTGCLGGRVTDNGAPGTGSVTLSGPSSLQVPLDAAGAFFVNGLAPGGWTASYQFAGEASPRVVSFLIPAGQCTVLNLQRTAGTGQRDIDVLVVLNDDGEPATSNRPVPGALVQLFGTDPASSLGLLGVTGQDGIARFERVDGPFFVTGQADVNGPATGVRARLTTTLPVIDPAPGVGIGLMLMFDEEPQPVLADSVVTGTVLNAPANGPTGELRLQATERGAGAAQLGLAFPNMSYQLGVRSGRPADLLLERIRVSGTSDAPVTLTAQVVPGITTAPGESRVLDLDYASPNRVPFGLPMGLTVTGALAAPEGNAVSLRGQGAGGEHVGFDLFVRSAGGAYPATVTMPEISAAGFAGYAFHLSVEEHGVAAPDMEVERTCTVRLGASTPASATVALVGTPGIVSPAAGAVIPADSASRMLVVVTVPPGVPGNGLNVVSFRNGGPGPEGVDAVGWTVFMPAASTSVTLRPPPRPVFAGGAAYGIEASLIRFGAPLAFDSVWTTDLNANLASFLGSAGFECDSAAMRLFGVTGGP